MCGIFGYFDQAGAVMPQQTFLQMGQVITHRGPDGQGGYHADEGVGLGNQRLAILDIAQGDQPFVSDDGNIVVVQNGEIFNHVELAEQLANTPYACRTHCDTEVILRLYEQQGIDFVSQLNGMFAIAIYDKLQQAVYLIRDRIGEKPLYVKHADNRVLFGSEIKSILQADDEKVLDLDALNQFLAFNYVPPPSTLFQGIKHVMPGQWMKITADSVATHRWWNLADQQLEDKTEQQWIHEFNTVLDDAVRIRLRADVPFGAFLSGGVDSSSVVGLMSKHMAEPVQSFCIGFDDPKYDESPFAQEAAERFNTQHIMQKVAPNMIDLWPMATFHCDQPHGDVSFLPTYKVAELASQRVKMVLTGDGADELFAGYDKYKHFFSAHTQALSENEFRQAYDDNIALFKQDQRSQLYSDKVNAALGDLSTAAVTAPLYDESVHMDRINQALYIDMQLLLSGNNLVKPDRMGMAVSIENRAPFLDYRMMELAFRMPGELKLKQGETKYIYKKAVTPLIGEHLAYRKKQMFTVPVGEWFKQELKPLCEELLLSEQATNRGLFNTEFVKQMFADHCEGSANNTREIRALMAVEIWFREFGVSVG